jgi:light-harvesting complex I chlorophyll a/b binding protein 4
MPRRAAINLVPPLLLCSLHCRHQQAELQNARWAMLGVAGILVQEIAAPDVNWYLESNLPQNLPGPFKNVNMGGLLAVQFCLMHWVELKR